MAGLTPEARLEMVRRELFPAVVGDVMDAMGLRNQFLPARIRPVRDDMVVLGRAMPVLETDVFSEESGAGENEVLDMPFGHMFRALDDLRPGEVYVCAGASPRYALWGGLMSTRPRGQSSTAFTAIRTRFSVSGFRLFRLVLTRRIRAPEDGS